MNLTSTTFICFSHFFYAFLCLCCLRTHVRSLGTVCVGSQSFRVRFVLCLFCWILDSLRKVLTNFESLSQPAKLVGKPDQPVHRIQFVGTVVWVFGTVCVGSQSFGVGFVIHLFFWIPDSLMKVLKNFESLSQLYELVGKPDHPVHLIQFAGTTVWVFGTVCVSS